MRQSNMGIPQLEPKPTGPPLPLTVFLWVYIITALFASGLGFRSSFQNWKITEFDELVGWVFMFMSVALLALELVYFAVMHRVFLILGLIAVGQIAVSIILAKLLPKNLADIIVRDRDAANEILMNYFAWLEGYYWVGLVFVTALAAFGLWQLICDATSSRIKGK